MTAQTPALPMPGDGCPKCVSRAVAPYRAEQAAPDSVRCWYRCPACLLSWCCWWSIRALSGEGEAA